MTYLLELGAVIAAAVEVDVTLTAGRERVVRRSLDTADAVSGRVETTSLSELGAATVAAAAGVEVMLTAGREEVVRRVTGCLVRSDTNLQSKHNIIGE